MTSDLVFQPVHTLAAEITARRLSPVEVVEAYLARIETHDAKLHAFTEIYAADARLAAEAADKTIRAGHAVGPLHGVPIAHGARPAATATPEPLLDPPGTRWTSGSHGFHGVPIDLFVPQPP